jgi:hypothetical protein
MTSLRVGLTSIGLDEQLRDERRHERAGTGVRCCAEDAPEGGQSALHLALVRFHMHNLVEHDARGVATDLTFIVVQLSCRVEDVQRLSSRTIGWPEAVTTDRSSGTRCRVCSLSVQILRGMHLDGGPTRQESEGLTGD